MSNKHMPYDLAQMKSLPLEAKIIMTKQRIRQWYDYWEGMVYVSVSGIDSTVLKHIVDSMYSDVPAVFVNTGLEYPEIQAFWKDVQKGKYACFNSDVEIIRPKIRFDEVLKKYGYPVISKEVSNTVAGARKSIKKGRYSLRLRQLGVKKEEYGGLHDDGLYDYEKTVEKSKFLQTKWRYLIDSDIDISEKCCYHTKKAPTHEYEKETGRKPFIGTLASESLAREAAWIKKGCNAFEGKRPTSQPLSFWTKQDILHYAKKYSVPYPPVYGDIVVDTGDDNQINFIDYLGCHEEGDKLKTTGCDRTGCIFCMFGCHLEKEPNRFQLLKQTHPRQYEYCIGGGEYVYKMFKRDEKGKWQEFDMAWEYDDGTPMTKQEIERFAQIHSVGFAGVKEEDMFLKCVKKWQPNKEGLGLGKVLDYIGVKYD